MPINLGRICDELNKIPGKPEDLDFVANFPDQSIWLRKKVKFPIKVATRNQIEDNVYRALAGAALEYATGGAFEFDCEKIIEQARDRYKQMSKIERYDAATKDVR